MVLIKFNRHSPKFDFIFHKFSIWHVSYILSQCLLSFNLRRTWLELMRVHTWGSSKLQTIAWVLSLPLLMDIKWELIWFLFNLPWHLTWVVNKSMNAYLEDKHFCRQDKSWGVFTSPKREKVLQPKSLGINATPEIQTSHREWITNDLTESNHDSIQHLSNKKIRTSLPYYKITSALNSEKKKKKKIAGCDHSKKDTLGIIRSH